MCHTLLQHYIHCRHTNIHFYHCHVDVLTTHDWPFSSFSSSSSSDQSSTSSSSNYAPRIKLKCKYTHPNYRPPSTFKPDVDDDPALWRSHDVPVGIAHSYRRKCPGCVREELRARMEDTEYMRSRERDMVQGWRDFAASSGEEEDVDYDQVAEDREIVQEEGDIAEGDVGGITRVELQGLEVDDDEDEGYASIDRRLLEQARRAIREAERRRRLAMDEGRPERRTPRVILRRPNAVIAGEQRTFSGQARARSPGRLRPAGEQARLGPRVRQRQAELDIMAQARRAEMQIWEQDGGDDGLTPQQRVLVFDGGPLLMPIPEELRAAVIRELIERQHAASNVDTNEVETGTSRDNPMWIDESSDETSHEPPDSGAGPVSGPVQTIERAPAGPALIRDVWPVTAAGVADQSTTNTTSSFREELDNAPEDDDADDITLQGQLQEETALSVTAADLYDFSVSRIYGDGREDWERVDVNDRNNIDNSPRNGEPELASTIDSCPCHSTRDWTTVCSQPTHMSNIAHIDSLESQAGTPSHRSFRLPEQSSQESLTEDTSEILVDFKGCGHWVAVFVERLKYENATDITTQCGCYGFDRCLVVQRKAVSRQKCPLCRIQRQKFIWARGKGQLPEDRCAWVDSWMRPVRTERERMLWPYGAKTTGFR